jgi:hypothetical protein
VGFSFLMIDKKIFSSKKRTLNCTHECVYSQIEKVLSQKQRINNTEMKSSVANVSNVNLIEKPKATELNSLAQEGIRVLESFLDIHQVDDPIVARVIRKARGASGITERIKFVQPPSNSLNVSIFVQSRAEKAVEFSLTSRKHSPSGLYKLLVQDLNGNNIWSPQLEEKPSNNGNNPTRKEIPKAFITPKRLEAKLKKENDDLELLILEIKSFLGDDTNVRVSLSVIKKALEISFSLHMKNDGQYTEFLHLLEKAGVLSRNNGCFFLKFEEEKEDVVLEPEKTTPGLEKISSEKKFKNPLDQLASFKEILEGRKKNEKELSKLREKLTTINDEILVIEELLKTKKNSI